MFDNMLLITILMTVVPAPIIYLIGKKIGKNVGYLVAGILFCISALYAFLLPLAEHESFLEEIIWTLPPVKLTFGLLADGLSIPILFTFMFVFAFVALFSIPYMEKRLQEGDMTENNGQYSIFFTLFLLYAGSIVGSVLSTNLIEFYLFFECALVFSWLLVLMYAYGERRRISFQYFIYTHIGGGSLLLGILGASWIIESFEISDLSNIDNSPMALIAGVAITIGLLVKIGGFGLHGWMPDTYSESPAPVSAVLGATSALLSTYSLSRLVVPFRHVLLSASSYIMLWAIVTILYAGIMAIVQKDVKRLVAYLSMSQMNYCVLGVLTYVAYGVIGAISYSISHGLAIALLFLVAGALQYKTNTRNMEKLGGLAKVLPIVLLACITGFLTIGGVPPAVGFKSKFILLTGAFERGWSTSTLDLTTAILAGTLSTVITVAYEFRAIWLIFYGKIPTELSQIKTIPVNMIIALLSISTLLIIFGFWPALFTNAIESYILNIFH